MKVFTIKRLPWIAIAAIVTFTAVALHSEGRVWWCQRGDMSLWSSDVNGPHNSQHVIDPYSVTHVVHGFLFFWLLAWPLPRLSFAWRLTLATAIEALWELVENTDSVVDRYRAVTMTVGYRGDSVINSLGDIVSCAVGFWLAPRLGLRWSILVVVALEVLMVIWIRDNLLLNIIMLVHPFDAIKQWQLGT